MNRRKIISLLLALIITITPFSVYASGEMTTDQASSQIKYLMEFILKNYAGDGKVNENTLYKAALKGMFDSLDKYSECYTPKEYKGFIESVSGEFGGIGVQIIKEDDVIKIVKPLIGTPGEKAGLKMNDIITAVEGKSIKGYTVLQAADVIKGKMGTPVKLTIKRGTQTFDVTIIRDKIKLLAVNAMPIKKLLPNEKNPLADKVWYIEITSFNANVADEFKKAVQDAKKAGVKGVIIDVRNNPGGLLDQVIEICKQVVPKGPIVHTVSKSGQTETVYSDLKKTPFKMIVLANKNSASASEIFVGAVKDSRAGIIVGEKTYGKGVVQKIYNYGPDVSFKLTVEEYLTRNEIHINNIGIEPQVKVIIPSYISDTNKILKKGNQDKTVKEIEDILKFLDYNINLPDEIYNEETYSAVCKFQQDEGLKVDGICNYETMTKLNETLFKKVKEHDPQLEMGLKILYEIMQ